MTNSNRFLRNLTDDPRCYVCSAVEENAEHLFRSCPVTTLVWRRFPWINDYKLFNKPFLDWIVSNFENKVVHGEMTSPLYLV